MIMDYDPVAKFYLHHSDKSKDFSLPKGVQTIPGAPSRALRRLGELRGVMTSFELLSMQPECSCLPQCQSLQLSCPTFPAELLAKETRTSRIRQNPTASPCQGRSEHQHHKCSFRLEGQGPALPRVDTATGWC